MIMMAIKKPIWKLSTNSPSRKLNTKNKKMIVRMPIKTFSFIMAISKIQILKPQNLNFYSSDMASLMPMSKKKNSKKQSQPVL